jgi:chromosome segregation ATPase
LTLAKDLIYTEFKNNHREMMKLGNDLIKNKFDDIDKKVDDLLEICRILRTENQELTGRIKQLESDLEEKIQTESRFSEQEAEIQTKIDGLLTKLDSFTR